MCEKSSIFAASFEKERREHYLFTRESFGTWVPMNGRSTKAKQQNFHNYGNKKSSPRGKENHTEEERR